MIDFPVLEPDGLFVNGSICSGTGQGSQLGQNIYTLMIGFSYEQ